MSLFSDKILITFFLKALNAFDGKSIFQKVSKVSSIILLLSCFCCLANEEAVAVKRTISITSETSANEENSSNVQLTTMTSEESLEEDVTKNVSLVEVMKLNSPEWKAITIGCIGSLVMGAAMPIFAVIFGDIVEVSLLPFFSEDFRPTRTVLDFVWR